jgi:hypothetical protein
VALADGATADDVTVIGAAAGGPVDDEHPARLAEAASARSSRRVNDIAGVSSPS